MKKILYRVIGNRFIQGGTILMITNLLVGFLNYLFNSLSGKILGPSGYSEIAAYSAYLTILSIPVQVITADLIRRLGAKGERKLFYLKNWENILLNKIFKWGFLFIPYFIAPFFLKDLLNLSLPFTIALFFVLAASFISVFYLTALQGIYVFFWYSVIAISATLIKLLGPLLVFLKFDGLATVAICLSVSAFVPIFFGKIIFIKLFKKIKEDTNYVPRKFSNLIFTKSTFTLFATFLLLNFLNNADIIIVKKFIPANISGLYGAWNLFSKMIFYLAGPLVSISYIFFSDINQKKYHLRGLALSLALIGGFGIIMFFVYKLFAENLILLMFNKQYLFISSYLPLAAFFGTFFTLINILSAYLVSQGSKLSIIGCIFIPFYIFFLYLGRTDILDIMRISVVFSLLITLVYLVAAIISARRDEKRFKKTLFEPHNPGL